MSFLQATLLERNNLESVVSKSYAYSAAGSLDNIPAEVKGSPHHPGGRLRCFKAVGTYIGDTDAVARATASALADKTVNARSLKYLRDTEKEKFTAQAVLLLIRYCLCSTANHFLRTTPPRCIAEAADQHDSAVGGHLLDLIDSPTPSPDETACAR